MAIFLIRHGETAGNANRVVQVPETPLSERGLAQGMSLIYRRTVLITLATLARLAAVTALVLLLAVFRSG